MMCFSKSLLLSLCALVLLAGCEQSKQSNTDHLNRAKEFQIKGDYRAAIIELKNALNIDAASKEVRFLLGEQYLAIGDGASAEKELRRAKELNPSEKRLPAFIARALLMQHKYAEVLKEFGDGANDQDASLLAVIAEAHLGVRDLSKANRFMQRALAKDATLTAVQLGLARVAFAEEDFPKTQQHLQRILANQPNFRDALLLSADVAFKQARYADAQATYSKLVDQSPGKLLTRWTFEARVGLIRALLAQDKLDLAKTHTEALLVAAPKHPVVKYLRGVVAYQQQEYETAMDYLQKTLIDLPNHLPSALLVGAIHYSKGNLEQADSYLTRFVSAVPTHNQARKLLGALRLKQNRAAEAVEILSAAADQSSDDAQLLAMVGRAAASAGDIDKGAAYIRRAIKADPESSVLRSELAQVYMNSGAFDQAIKELEILARTGDGKQAKIMLISAYLRSKDFKAARALAVELNQESPNDPAMKTLQGGINLLEGSRDKARAAFNEALQLQVSFAPAKLNLARMALQENDLNTAASYFDEVVKVDAKNVAALLGLAQIAEQKNDIPQAVSWLEKARSADVTALIPRLILGKHAIAQNDAKKAMEVAAEAYTQRPEEPAVLLLLGRAQSAAKKYDDALATYQHLVKRMPNASGAYLELANVQAKIGQREQAKAAIKRALALTPELPNAQVALAFLEWDTGNRAEAFGLAKRLQRTKHSALGYGLMGDLQVAQGDNVQAQLAYEQSLKSKSHAEMLEKLARSYSFTGNHQKATMLLSDWIKSHAKDSNIQLALADVYAEANDFAKAEAQYLQILADNPSNAAAHNNLALSYIPVDLERAHQHAEAAYKLMPDHPSVMDTLGWVLFKKGSANEGLEMLKKAASLTQAPSVQYHLAVVMVKTGAKIQGRDILKSLLQVNKSFKEKDEAQRLFASL